MVVSSAGNSQEAATDSAPAQMCAALTPLRCPLPAAHLARLPTYALPPPRSEHCLKPRLPDRPRYAAAPLLTADARDSDLGSSLLACAQVSLLFVLPDAHAPWVCASAALAPTISAHLRTHRACLNEHFCMVGIDRISTQESKNEALSRPIKL